MKNLATTENSSADEQKRNSTVNRKEANEASSAPSPISLLPRETSDPNEVLHWQQAIRNSRAFAQDTVASMLVRRRTMGSDPLRDVIMSGEVTADTPLAALRKKSGILADPRTSEKIGAIAGGRKSAESEKRAGDPLLAKRDSILAMIDKRRSSILDEARNSVFADRKTSLIEGEQPSASFVYGHDRNDMASANIVIKNEAPAANAIPKPGPAPHTDQNNSSNMEEVNALKSRAEKEQKFPLFDRRRSGSTGKNALDKMEAELKKRLSEISNDSRSSFGSRDYNPPALNIIPSLNKSTILEEDESQYRSKINLIKKSSKKVITPQAIKKPIPIIKESKKSALIILDPLILDKAQTLELNPDLSNDAKIRPKMAFSKASTGRLDHGKVQDDTDEDKKIKVQQEVMLVGQKIGNEIIKVKESRRVVHDDTAKTLEPFYSEEVKQKKANLQMEREIVERAEKEQLQAEQDLAKNDTGVFHNIMDVDAVIPHFAAILEVRKRNLKAGVDDTTTITPFVEPPKMIITPKDRSVTQTPIPDSTVSNGFNSEPSSVLDTPLDYRNGSAQVTLKPSNPEFDPLPEPMSVSYDYSIGIEADPLIHAVKSNPSPPTENSPHLQKIVETFAENNAKPPKPTSAKIRFDHAENVNASTSKKSTPNARSSSAGSTASGASILKNSSRHGSANVTTRSGSAASSKNTQDSCSCTDSSCSYCYALSRSESVLQESEFDESDMNGNQRKFNYKSDVEDPLGRISLLNVQTKKKSIPVRLDLAPVERVEEIKQIPNEETPKSRKKGIKIEGKTLFNEKPPTTSTSRKAEKTEGKTEMMKRDLEELLTKLPDIILSRSSSPKRPASARYLQDNTQIPNTEQRKNHLSEISLDENLSPMESMDILQPDLALSLASLTQQTALEMLPEDEEIDEFPDFKNQILTKEDSLDSLDLQVKRAIEQYEIKKLQKRKKNIEILRRYSARKSEIMKKIQISVPSAPEEQVPGDENDGYVTEDDQQKPVRNKAKELWMIIKRHLQKKFLINRFAVKPEEGEAPARPEQVITAKPMAAALEALLEQQQSKKKHLENQPKIDAIVQYQLARRAADMEKFPELYKGKKINPETNELETESTLRPIVGIAETERAKLPGSDLDPEKAHLLSVRNGVILNGYVQGSKRTLYDVIHNAQRRLVSLTGADRAKYPTYDDPGPPVDAAGVPIPIKEGSTTPIPEVDLNEELKNVELLMAEPNGATPSNLRRRGIILARMEKFARAMEDIDTAVHMEPQNQEGLWHRQQLYLRLNDAESALGDLDALTDLNKAHFASFQAKARLYQALGMYKLAIHNYSFVIRFKSENVDAYHNRACLYEIEDEIVLANEDFRFVRLLDPTNDQAIHNIAMYSFQRQLWSDCIHEFSKLIRIDPENDSAYMYRGRSYAALSFFAEAMQDLTQAIRLAPDNAMYFFHRGCLLREQHIQKAIQDFSISITLDGSSDNCDAYFYRAQLYQKQKQNDLAILDYLTVIDLNPKKSKAYLNLGVLHMKHTKNYAEALTCLNKGISTDQISLRGYISRGELYEILYRQALLQQANVNIKRKLRKLDTATNYAMMAIKDYSRAIHLRPCNYLLFLYRGRMLLKQGKVEEATIDFHAAFDLNSSIAQTFMQRALILSFQRKYKQIIEEYDQRKAANIQAKDPALLLLVAKARIRYGDFEGALTDLNSVTDQARIDHQISLQKGICYEHLKNWSMASAEFTNCINQMPNFSKAYYHRGLCKLAEQDSTGEYDLNKAIELDPKFFDAYVTRAAYYESVKKFAKGIADCDEALRLEPTSIRAHILRGSCKCKLYQYVLAISDFSKAISIDKTSPFAFYNRAIAYQYAGDSYNAIKDYSIVLLLQDNENAYKNRAMIYWNLGDNENALMDFYAAKQLNPKDSKLRSLLGLGLQKVGKFGESCQEFTVAMDLDSNMKEAILGRGNVYAAMGDNLKSRKDYSRVLHMYPLSSDTLINIAYTMQSEGRPKDAWRYFTMAYTIDPQCTAALKGRALVNSSTNNPFSAYLDITRAIEISPENAELLNNRGVIYESLNDNVSAYQNYRLAIKADPKFGLAYYNAGNHQLMQHNWEKGVEYFTKAIECDFNDESALLNRGIAHLMLKNYKTAREDIQEVLQMNPESKKAYFNMGYLHSLLGEYEKAEEIYTKVIKMAPNDKVSYLCRAEARSKLGKWKLALEDYSRK